MADILNFDAIPQNQRAQSKANLLAYWPNTETIIDPEWKDTGDGSRPNRILKYTDLDWLNEKVWKYLERCNKRGHVIRVNQAATAAVNIREP